MSNSTIGFGELLAISFNFRIGLLVGRQGRTKLYAVVGDERIGSLKEFADLNLVHEQLIATLHLRAAVRRKNIALAKLKAAPLAGRIASVL
jgi:adenylate cyclase